MTERAKSQPVAAPIPESGTPGETFGEFKNSFSYGSRSHLLYKFLRLLPPEQAAEFFESVLRDVGDSLDDGSFDRVVQTVYDWQVRGYAPDPDAPPRFDYTDGPFTPLKKPLSESRVALLSSGGHFVRGNDPEPLGYPDMTQADAEDQINEYMKVAPILSDIPVDTSAEDMVLRHGGYDVRGAALDHNVVLPIDAMKTAEAEGRIGEFHPTAFSFVGATSQLRLRELVAGEWADRFRDEGIEAFVMVPV